MRELQSLEQQAVNGGASGLVIGVGIAAIVFVSAVAIAAIRRSSGEVVVVVEHDHASEKTNDKTWGNEKPH
jgi:hypothetical protein